MDIIQEAKSYIANITEGYTLEVDLISRLVDRLEWKNKESWDEYYKHIIAKDGGYHLVSIGIEYDLDGDMPWAMMKTVIEFYGLPVSGWFSIDTAPKDGTKVDIYITQLEERYPDCYYCKEEQAWVWVIEGTGKQIVFTATPPTHWMPLPLPPVGDK